MTDILCKWMNEELLLSQVVEPKTIAKAFSSGYLFGEILHKYQLQNDFSMFMRKERSISMLNNFTRLERSFHLLGIPFSATTAQEVMREKQGVAAHIVHQLYISLERKKKADISGTVMKVMQPTALASLHKKEHEIYCDRLHKVVKRDAQVNLERMSKYYEDKVKKMSRSEVTTAVQKKNAGPKQEENVKRSPEKVKVSNQKPNELMPANQISVLQASKPVPHLTQLNLRRQQRQQRQEKLAQYVKNEIAQFETKRRKLPSSFFSNLEGYNSEVQGIVSKPELLSNSMYIQLIRQRLEEDTLAQEQRDKKADRFLLEQAKAREAEQNAKHEEYLIKRLTRPTKQEQRLVAQLLQIRRQKEVFINNRLFREQQVQQRREKDLQEAVKWEAVLAEQEKMARAEEIKRKLDFCNRLEADQNQIIYQKHAESCKEVVEQIVDLATKVGEYRLSGNPVPEKQMKEWKEVLFSGLPLYDPTNVEDNGRSMDMHPVEVKKQDILNNLDYDEYVNMTGEWMWPEEGETKLPPTNNNILGSVIARLRRLVHPPCEKPADSPFPFFTLKACVLGKLCSGKTSCLAKIAQVHDIHILSAQALVNEAVNAYHVRETITEQQELSDHENQMTSDDGEDVPQDVAITKLSKRAMYGREASKEMKEGNVVPPELLVKIISEAVKQIPANSGWILDGFPDDITQAHLLEKALVGNTDKDECTAPNSQMNLALDPDPPKAPPPPPPALNLALLLDVSDECAVSRGVKLAYEAAAGSIPDYLYMSQIPHRITAFQKTWPILEEWFGTEQNILVRVDASVDEEELFNSVDSVLQQIKRPVPEVVPTPPDEAPDDGTALQDLSTTPSFSPSTNQELTNNQNLTESSSSVSTEKEGKKKMEINTENLKLSSRRPSITNESSSKKVDKPLPPGLPETLYQHWENVCEMYVNNIKAVMQELRSEGAMINQHFLNIKEDFKHYLSRPDLRQEVVSQWQKDFNNVADDMRDDEEIKAELHQRLDELCKHLCNRSEKRKEENEQERATVTGDGWLLDHSALLVNYHSILTQVELDRFRDTFCILQKYYMSMNSKPMAELPSNLTTITLLDASSLQDLDTQSQAQSEYDQLQKKLIEDYEATVSAINSLFPSAVQQREAEPKQTKEKAQEKPPSANKGKKRPPSEKKKKGAPSLAPAPSPEQTEIQPTDKTMTECTTALHHEEEAAKVRIAVVKGHGLCLVDFIQSNAEQTFKCMQEWLEEHFDKEMKSIEQLSEVVRHYIESGAKLQKQLVLDHTHFCLNGDFQMVPLPPLPSRPPSIETASQSTLSIVQLDSVCQQFRRVAPIGLLPCLEFSTLFKVIFGANKGRQIFPEQLVNMPELQLKEMVASLKDECEFVDWRRFMLSCAQPWPMPSVTQLLDALQRLKATDVEDKGYIIEEQYLQIQLWFPKESVQEIPEDPSEPLPYNRLSNLHKFFFQLLADHSFSPPRLHYTSMLQYLSADSNPKQGFVRALSVVVGQHLRVNSSTQLVKSMPSLEEVPEFSSADLDVLDYSDAERPTSSALLGNQKVSLPALLSVIGHSSRKDSQSEDTEQLVGVYKDLGYEPEDSIPFSTLSTHPFIQRLMESSTQHRLVNIYH